MTIGNATQNVTRNVALDLPRIEEEAGTAEWYRIEGGGHILFGPYGTKVDATLSAEDAPEEVNVGQFRRKVIGCDVFCAPDVFDGVEDRNEESVYRRMRPNCGRARKWSDLRAARPL